MPKVVLGHTLDDVPVTVATVARQVGVSPSTLRSWERRYGLGPSVRTIGAHRRYTALDIARVQRMSQLISQGISASDAAQLALAESVDDLEVDVTVTVSVEALIDAVNAADTVVVRSIVDRAIATDGLVHAWTRLICPTLAAIEDNPQVSGAGHAPRVMLRQTVLRAIQRVVGETDDRYCPGEGTPPDVVVAVETDSIISGHVLAAAMQWEHVLTGVLSTAPAKLGRALEAYCADNDIKAIIVVDSPPGICEAIAAIHDRSVVPVYFVGADCPCLVSEHVTRLHTLSAAVAEIVDLSTHW